MAGKQITLQYAWQLCWENAQVSIVDGSARRFPKLYLSLTRLTLPPRFFWRKGVFVSKRRKVRHLYAKNCRNWSEPESAWAVSSCRIDDGTHRNPIKNRLSWVQLTPTIVSTTHSHSDTPSRLSWVQLTPTVPLTHAIKNDYSMLSTRCQENIDLWEGAMLPINRLKV